jgi:hypothetical protein
LHQEKKVQNTRQVERDRNRQVLINLLKNALQDHQDDVQVLDRNDQNLLINAQVLQKSIHMIVRKGDEVHRQKQKSVRDQKIENDLNQKMLKKGDQVVEIENHHRINQTKNQNLIVKIVVAINRQKIVLDQKTSTQQQVHQN